MSNMPLTRLVVQLVASVGVSKVVNDVIKNNVTVTSTFQQVNVWTGSIVIGSLIGDVASKHVDDRTTQVINWYQARKDENNSK
jgi:hypothetical protein